MLLGPFLVKSCAVPRNNRPQVFDKKRALNNFKGKQLSQGLFFDKPAG